MTSEIMGKLVIRDIPNDDVMQQVVAYMFSNSRNATPEAIATRLATLPIASSSISAQTGNRVTQALIALGADALFIPDQPTSIPIVSGTSSPAPPAEPQTFSAPTPCLQDPSQAYAASSLNSSPLPVAPDSAAIDKEFPASGIPINTSDDHGNTVSSTSDFSGQAATASWVAPVITVIFLSLAQSALKNSGSDTGWLIVGGIAILLYVAGIILGIIGILGSRRSVNNILRPSIAGICLNMVFLGIFLFGASKAFDVEKKLVFISKKVNMSLPKEVEDGIRLETTTAGPDKKFTYTYTFLNYQSTDLSNERFKEQLWPKLRHGTCADNVLKSLLKKGATIAFQYNGSDGGFVAEIPVVLADCGTGK